MSGNSMKPYVRYNMFHKEMKKAFKNSAFKKVDFIMANPPFNLKGWRKEDELKDDSR